jgi:hypothetical protein
VAPFPAPATSHVACGFPALRVPAHFATRVMRPVGAERLPRMAIGKPLGTHERAQGCRTAIPGSAASTQSPGVDRLRPSGAEPSSLPSFGYTKSIGSCGMDSKPSARHRYFGPLQSCESQTLLIKTKLSARGMKVRSSRAGSQLIPGHKVPGALLRLWRAALKSSFDQPFREKFALRQNVAAYLGSFSSPAGKATGGNKEAAGTLIGLRNFTEKRETQDRPTRRARRSVRRRFR